MTPSDRSLALTFKNRLLETGVPLCSLYVFGSRARGDALEDSDLDTLVVVENKTPLMKNRIYDCAWEVGFESGVLIECIVAGAEQVRHDPFQASLLMKAVREEGIEI